ncbi:MAG TPA: hypothetical protein VIX12_08310, partial [Candidatus Binataceae bacterium]
MMGHDMTMAHDSHIEHGANMMLHMKWTDLRPASDQDKRKAAEIVETLQASLAKYKDYHAAEAQGFKPFHPELKTPIVHFTRNWNAVKAAFLFDPAEPTSLLYKHTPDGGYELIGAMYTAPKRTSEDKLNERVPLSVARWHQHVNICFPPKGTGATADWTKFGPGGSIAAQAACEATNGRWVPVLFGWMVHVYPWEKNPQEVWAH